MVSTDYESLALSLGLKKKDYDKLLAVMGRVPSLTELVVFVVFWFEDQGANSSRFYVTNLHKKNPYFPPNNEDKLGYLPLNDEDVLVFTMGSCNHFSDEDAYKRGAIGASAVTRRLYTKAARPIALLGHTHFGDGVKKKASAGEVVKGIKDYVSACSIGYVSVKEHFHKSFNGASLVNIFGIGVCHKALLKMDSLKPNALILYIGRPTSLEGHHYLGDLEAHSFKLPEVFPGQDKEAMSLCEKLLESQSILSVQEVGLGGLITASLGILKKTGLGISIELDKVPLAIEEVELNELKAYEILSSETMGRFLIAIDPEKLPFIEEILQKTSLSYAIIGNISERAHFDITFKGQKEANIALASLFDEAPLSERDAFIEDKPFPIATPIDPVGIEAGLKRLLKSSDLLLQEENFSPIERDGYHLEKTGKRLFFTTCSQARYVHSDPYLGSASTVVSAWRHLTARGGKVVAMSSMLNFGSPDNTRIMGQFIRAIDGIKEASMALGCPILGKNISFYNETNEETGYVTPIQSAPVIGAISILEKGEKSVSMAMPEEGELFLLGESRGEMGQSLWLREICKREDGAPPNVDFRAEMHHGTFIREQIAQDYIDACCDVSDGGLLVAVTKMAVLGGVGCILASSPSHLPFHAYWFAEDGARYIVATRQGERFFEEAEKAKIPVRRLGKIGGRSIGMGYGAHFPLEDFLEINHSKSF